MWNSDSPRLMRGLPLVMSALLLMPLAASAGERKEKKEPTPQEIQKQHAEIKARNKQIDVKQREEYLRAVPSPDTPGAKDESDVVKIHSAREWYLLTYPTGTRQLTRNVPAPSSKASPSQPKRRARRSRMRRPP